MEFRKMFVLFAVILAVSGMAMAIRGVTEMTDPTFLDRWEGMTATGNVTTEGGNISWQNMNGSSLTDRWAGFYGDVTAATIYLIDNDTAASSPTDYLYHWVASGSETGEICVSTNQSFNFANAQPGTAGDIDFAWGFTGSDTGTNTYNATVGCNITFEEQGVSVINAAKSVHQGQSNFVSCLLYDPGVGYHPDDFAFCTYINSTPGTIYNGSNAEYELIVPTNDSTVTATETYWFFIEID